MQHPDITYTERFGSRWEFADPEFIGECSLPSCRHKDIFDNYEYWIDDFGHLFCCLEHAENYYGLKCVS